MIADSIASPIVETFGGRTITFPVLSTKDIGLIGRQVLHDRMTAELVTIDMTDTNKRDNVTAFYRTARLSVQDYADLTSDIEDAQRFIRASLAKAGEPPETIPGTMEAIIKEWGLISMTQFSKVVSGLWGPMKKKVASLPNAGKSSETGSGDQSTTPLTST